MPDNLLESQLTECRRVALLEARRRGLSVVDSEDVAQEVSLDMWVALTSKKTIRSIAAWTRTTTARRIVDLHRQSMSCKRGGGLVGALSDHSGESAFAI